MTHSPQPHRLFCLYDILTAMEWQPIPFDAKDVVSVAYFDVEYSGALHTHVVLLVKSKTPVYRRWISTANLNQVLQRLLAMGLELP